VADYGDGDRDPDLSIYLEAKAYAYAVQKAVAAERQGRQNADLRMEIFVVLSGLGWIFMGLMVVSVMDEQKFLADVKQQKTKHKRDHNGRYRKIVFVNNVEGFGEDVEGDHPQNYSSGKPQNAVNKMVIADAYDAADERREERGDG